MHPFVSCRRLDVQYVMYIQVVEPEICVWLKRSIRLYRGSTYKKYSLNTFLGSVTYIVVKISTKLIKQGIAFYCFRW